jgi:hypothetical protein
MVERCEKSIKIGYVKKPSVIFDEVETICNQMTTEGWVLKNTCVEEGLGYIHLFFERHSEY